MRHRRPAWYRRVALTAPLVILVLVAAGAWAASDELVCGDAEVTAVAMWKPWWFLLKPADRPAPSGTVLATPVTMRDGVILRGIVVPAARPSARRKALLVLYGNLAYSDVFYQMLKPLAFFDFEYDTVIYDYRGYWRSDGTPRYHAIVDDVGEVVKFLEGRYDEIRVYGSSLGALIASRAIGDDDKVKAIFLDGISPRLSDLSKDCPTGRLDPVDMSESTCRKVTLLLGANDTIFPSERARPFIDRMRSCGNSHFSINADLGHSYSEAWSDRDRASAVRGAIIREWLSAEQP